MQELKVKSQYWGRRKRAKDQPEITAYSLNPVRRQRDIGQLKENIYSGNKISNHCSTIGSQNCENECKAIKSFVTALKERKLNCWGLRVVFKTSYHWFISLEYGFPFLIPVNTWTIRGRGLFKEAVSRHFPLAFVSSLMKKLARISPFLKKKWYIEV